MKEINVEEFDKCKVDPVYFYENYVVFDGGIKPDLTAHQKAALRAYAKGQHFIMTGARTSTKSFLLKIVKDYENILDNFTLTFPKPEITRFFH